ncbi:MAG: glycosyltransferase family 4 protein [Acidobacteria bacterium]|nr:glycosyltransferase family 4 protein [Acidobacteriota bacterium]
MEITNAESLSAELRRPEIAAPLGEATGARGRASLPSRIAYVLHGPVIGGVEIATLRLACAIKESGGFRPIAFCHGEQTSVSRMFDESGIETVSYTAGHFSYFHPGPFWRGVHRFARELHRHRIDLIHCADMTGAYHAGAAAKWRRTPLLCHIRSNFPNFELRYKPPLLAVDRFAFVSHATWRNFNKIFRVHKSHGTVVYDWAPPPPLRSLDGAAARQRVRRELGMESDAPVFGMIARIAPQKDFETLLNATARVVALLPSARLLLVGEYQATKNDAAYPEYYEYYQRLRRLIEEKQLSEHVIFMGFRDDIPDLLRAMDVMVLCTHSEGLPLVLLEAMGLGCPVIATSVGGVPELVLHNETGLLHEHADDEELARQILLLINDKQKAVALAEGGRRFVSTRFSRERTVKDVKDLYLRLLGARSVAHPAGFLRS